MPGMVDNRVLYWLLVVCMVMFWEYEQGQKGLDRGILVLMPTLLIRVVAVPSECLETQSAKY